ncbi:MAG: extracellular solute-binding protein [Bacillota bacterium]|nr:extracellular solute-binding protein [Bacillota bacterium]
MNLRSRRMPHPRGGMPFWMLVLAALLSSVVTSACQRELVPVAIEIWDGPRPDASDNKFGWMEARIAEFSAKHPNVTVSLVKVPWQEMITGVDRALVSKDFPDIVPLHIGTGGIRFEHLADGLLEPVDGYLDEDDTKDLYPAAIDAFKSQGKTYGFALGMNLHLMLLNLDIFQERGVAPPKDGTWTFDEFRETARKLTFARGKQKTPVYGFAAYIQKGYYEMWPFLYMDGARPLSPDMAKFTFDSPQAVSALQKMVDLKTKSKAASPDTGSSDHALIWYAFASLHERRVAMEPWADWAVQLAVSPEYKMNIMVARYPTGASGKPVTIGRASGFTVLRQTDKTKRALVMELCSMLTSSAQQEYFASKFGLLPARRSAASSARFPHPELKRAAGFLEEVELPPNHPKWVQIENSINAEIQAAVLGEKTVEQALKDARREVEALISLSQ